MTAPVIPSESTQETTSEAPETTAAPKPVAPAAAPQPGAWREGLSEGLRENPVLGRFETLDALGNEHVNLQKHIGTEKTSLPQANWEDKDYDGLYKALGRPDAPGGYDLSDFAPPEGVPWDDEFQNRMVAHLHGAGLNQRQLRQVLASYSEEISGQVQDASRFIKEQNEATETALHKEWGSAYAEKLDLARRGIREFAGDRYEEIGNLQLADGGLLGNNLAFVSMFAKVGEEMSEAGLIGQKGSPLGYTPEGATAERNRLMADKGFLDAYLNKEHPEHGAAVQRAQDLTAAEMGDRANRVVT